jgi:hypothetical protein
MEVLRGAVLVTGVDVFRGSNVLRGEDVLTGVDVVIGIDVLIDAETVKGVDVLVDMYTAVAELVEAIGEVMLVLLLRTYMVRRLAPPQSSDEFPEQTLLHSESGTLTVVFRSVFPQEHSVAYSVPK